MVYQLDLNLCTFDFALSSCLSLPSVYVYCVYPIMSKSIKKKKKCKILLLKSKNTMLDYTLSLLLMFSVFPCLVAIA
jgi:hypothetical protein